MTARRILPFEQLPVIFHIFACSFRRQRWIDLTFLPIPKCVTINEKWLETGIQPPLWKSDTKAEVQ
jgi:hypothetical protein